MEFAQPDYDKYDLSSVRIVLISGAMAPMELLTKMVNTICPNCYNSLGLTEVSGLITYTPKGASLETLNKTVGRCAPEFEMKLVDKERNPVPDGTPGEIAYRGTSVIKEYYKLPEATAAAIDEEGWFYSGDLGLIDEDGNLRMVGRAKELYITGGYNVYPAEVEEYIMRYPGVMMCACVAVPHKIMGEVGRAYVVPQPGETLDGDAIQRFLQDYLADYKIPRQFIFRDSLPMTLLGKIEKKLLRQEVEKEFA
ncbi:MAG: class I adenylate-forming enzyme family protein, partial [Chitinophagales bacterium]